MSEFFTLSRMNTANNLRSEVITNIAQHIEKCFKECAECGGTGLEGVRKNKGSGFVWTGGFCDNCKGSGYIGWKKSDLLFICETCEGIGKDNDWEKCPACEGAGVLDWVQHIKGCV